MEDKNWACSKCGCTSFDTAQIRASGGALAAVFDVSNKKFTTVTCKQCSFTELYRAPISGLQKIFEIIGSV